MNRTLSLVAFVAAAGSAVAQVSPRVIYTKIPGHPTAVVPGAKDLDGNAVDAVFRAMEDLVSDPNHSGSWMLKSRTNLGSDLETCMLAAAGGAPFMFAQEGQPAPGGVDTHRYDFFASAMGRYDTAGNYVFGFRARQNVSGTASYPPDAQRIAVWNGSTIDVRIKQGDLLTGLQDTNPQGDELVGNSVGSAHLLDSGVIGTQDSTITNIHTSRRPAIMYDHAGFQQSNVSAMTALDGSAATWATFLANTFYTTPDGQHWIALGRRSGQGTSDDMMAYDNVAVIETGSSIGDSGVIVSDVFAADVQADGSWYARGDDGNSDDWFARNGEVLAKTGDPIIPGSSESWGDTFLAFAANANGDWILIGTTNEALPDRNTVVVLNGVEVLLREGDPIDLDGNGQFDDNVFIGRANAANAAFQANGIQLANDGTVYMLINIRDADGIEYNSNPAFGSPSAFVTFDITPEPGCGACSADYNQDGGVDGADVEAFFIGWEAAESCSDVNQDGGIDGGDVETFFIAWENGGC